MTRATPEVIRALAIDPTPRGFGYVILEGPGRLVDWGIADARTTKNPGCLKRLQQLVGRYHPDVLIVEDYTHRVCRRRPRIRALLSRIRETAARHRLRCRRIPWRAVSRTFDSTGTTREEIATILANRFPEIALRVPRPRKAWMPEDPRLSIFDALARALAFLEIEQERKVQVPHAA